MQEGSRLESTISAEFLDGLIRGLNHDLGASARHVRSFAELLYPKVSPHLDAEQQTWFGFISAGGENIQSLLSGLTVLTTLTSPELRDEPVDPEPLLRQSVETHQASASGPSTSLSLELNGDWTPIIGRRLHWDTLFSCAVENAIRFQPKDPGHRIVLRATFDSSPEDLSFSLEDNGIGATKEQIASLNRPFKRLHSDEYEGSGLGLTYCRLIAELNKGSLTLSPSSLGGLMLSYRQPKPVARQTAPAVLETGISA